MNSNKYIKRLRSLLHLVYLVCLLGFSAQGQEVSVSEAVSLRKGDYYQILGRINGRLLMTSDNSYSLDLFMFDQRLRNVDKKELTLNKYRTQIVGIIPDKQFFTVIYQSGRKGEASLTAHRYDDSGNLKDSTTFLTFPVDYDIVDCRLSVSENQKKALIYYVKRPSDLHIMVLDLDSLRLDWQTKVTIDPQAFFRHFRTMLVDNKGMMHLLLQKDNSKNKIENHTLELLQFAPDWVQPLSRFVSLQNIFSQTIKFQVDNINNRLVCAGLYSNKSNDRANGVYGFYLDHTDQGALDLFLIPFDEETARKLTGNPTDSERGIEDLSILQILPRYDGGMVVLLEEYRKQDRNISGQQFQFGPGGARFVTDYYYEDLMTLSLSPTGDVDWMDIFPKKQYSQDDDGLFSSVFVMTGPDRLQMIYNDEIALENTVSAYRVDYRGMNERVSVLSTNYQKLKLIFREAVQTDINEIIVPSERAGKVKLVQVLF